VPSWATTAGLGAPNGFWKRTDAPLRDDGTDGRPDTRLLLVRRFRRTHRIVWRPVASATSECGCPDRAGTAPFSLTLHCLQYIGLMPRASSPVCLAPGRRAGPVRRPAARVARPGHTRLLPRQCLCPPAGRGPDPGL
jgi:hypothetical protein